MRPRKAKEFIPHVAETLALPEDCVANIINYYYQELRKSLSSLKHQRIHVTNLGDFVIKHWNVDDKIDMLERWEEKNRLKGLQEITARFKTAETLFDLKHLKKIMEEEKQRMEFIKLYKKTNNESKREHNQDMESQGANS